MAISGHLGVGQLTAAFYPKADIIWGCRERLLMTQRRLYQWSLLRSRANVTLLVQRFIYCGGTMPIIDLEAGDQLNKSSVCNDEQLLAKELENAAF